MNYVTRTQPYFANITWSKKISYKMHNSEVFAIVVYDVDTWMDPKQIVCTVHEKELKSALIT